MKDIVDVEHEDKGEGQRKPDDIVLETEADDSSYSSTEEYQSDDNWFDEDLNQIDDVIGEIQNNQRLNSAIEDYGDEDHIFTESDLQKWKEKFNYT